MSTPTPAADCPDGTPAPCRHPQQVVAVLLLACVSFALTQTLVIPALPAIASEYGTTVSTASWILTGFLLAASVATPIVGKLGDLYGRGRVLTGVLAIFTVGSVVNALAPTIEVLIAGRVLQGVAGGVFPLAFGIVRDTSPRDKVPGHLALLSAVFGIGGGIGLTLSGVIVDHADLSLLFWLGLISAPAAVAAYQLIPHRTPATHGRIDWVGAALLSVALASVLLGVTHAERWGWTSVRTLGLMIGGVVVALLWGRWEQRVREPLIQLSVLRERAMAATNLTAFLIGMSMFSSFLLIPQFAQTPEEFAGYGFGFSVTASGLLLVPSAIVQLGVGPMAGKVGVRIGFRRVLAIGTSLCASSFVLIGLVRETPWEFAIAGMLLGGGISISFAAMANLVVAAAPGDQVGIATGLNTVVRTVGGSFGSAIATAILAAHLVNGIPTEDAYAIAFWMSAVIGVLATGAALLVPRHVEERSAAPQPAAAAAD